MTKQRQAVLDVLKVHQGEHLTPEEVCELLKKGNVETSLATVYRTLSLLYDLGFLEKFFIKNGFRYEFKEEDSKHSHHHLICTSCGSITEIHGKLIDGLYYTDYLEDLEVKIENEHHFHISDHNLQFFGLCNNCYDKDRPS